MEEGKMERMEREERKRMSFPFYRPYLPAIQLVLIKIADFTRFNANYKVSGNGVFGGEGGGGGEKIG